MIQDINPSKLYNEFNNHKMTADDICLFYDKDGRLLIKEENGAVTFTHGSDTQGSRSVFLFSVDDTRFFLTMDESNFQKNGYTYKTIREIRDICSGKEVFAAFTAYHLWRWYADNRYCFDVPEAFKKGHLELLNGFEIDAKPNKTEQIDPQNNNK